MRTLSATDAFTPAIERTKAILRPFSLKLWLKLGLVALIAEMGMQFIFPPVGGPPHSSSSGIGASAGGVNPLLITVFVVAGVVMAILGLALLYFGSRMQLVLMEMVATRSTLVAPSWRNAGPKTWPWIGLKLLCFVIAIAVVGAIVAVPLIYLFRSMPPNSTAQPNPAFWGSFFLIFTTIFVAVFVLLIVIWALRDFVLPFMLFEDAKVGAAVSRTVDLIRRETGSVLFYFLMKFAFTMAAGLAAELCLLAALFVIAIPTGIIGGGFWFALHNAGEFGILLMYVSFGLLGVASLAVFFTAIICIGGAVLIFNQAYALYFIGGRIPRLGDLLEPPPPPFFEGSPQALSPF
ncbi:hypothetical protein EDE15_3607 [Edaphobacter aggregans]|uniref:Glycerophosphoryl diester phosphodiesterase family protein n=1 Tax=Edaphobacter aggregans TaxID=570835 RepID=A0A428MM64_9BACT|nr:hypothetical protein [Edaphobacter aggregans]RSL18051.1 hypothetical protein EDE15_3607 [Edaphobacter aggregans]